MTDEPQDPSPSRRPARGDPSTSLFASMAELRRFELLLDHVDDIITVLGEDAGWKYTSPSGSRAFGYPRGYDPEGGIMALVHPDDVSIATNALADVLDGTRGPDDPVRFRVVAADGSVLTLESVGVNLVTDPDVRGVIITSRVLDADG